MAFTQFAPGSIWFLKNHLFWGAPMAMETPICFARPGPQVWVLDPFAPPKRSAPADVHRSLGLDFEPGKALGPMQIPCEQRLLFGLMESSIAACPGLSKIS